MDIPPVPNQPTSFIFPLSSFGMANPVKRSFQASWFSTRTWLRHLNLNGLLVPRQTEIPHQGGGGGCARREISPWLSQEMRTWTHSYTETYKISSASRAKIVPKCIKIVCTDVRKYKIFLGGDPPNPTYERGNVPFCALPQLVPSALVKRL